VKKLAFYGFAFSLLIAATGALADDRGHGKHHGKRHYPRDHHYDHGYGHHYGHYIPYRQHRYYSGYYRPNYYPSYVGAALLGSAITYILFHTHDGEHCSDNHGYDGYPQSSRSSEVVGCHRIELFPDGSERRVEVPMSQCL
jgi:hypothetical protein